MMIILEKNKQNLQTTLINFNRLKPKKKMLNACVIQFHNIHHRFIKKIKG
jgi:hypothetical protein